MKKIVLVAAIALSVILSGCSSGSNASQYQGICVDEVTRVRLSDDVCSRNTNNHAVMMWLLLSGTTNNYIVPVNQPLPQTNSYVRTIPYDARIAPPAPKSGGTVVKDNSKAIPADKWVEKNPAYKNKVVQDKKPVQQQNRPQDNNKKNNNGGYNKKPAGGGYKQPAVRRK